ncbi:MAG TPA: hypothetical protein VIR29_08110 [Anseongella sp.]
MKLFLIQLVFIPAFFHAASAQQVVFDRRHLNIVNENGAVRLAAENMHNGYLKVVNDRLDDIRLNLTALVTVRHMVLRSLAEVDQALKSGRAVLNISRILEDVFYHNNQILELARREPWLLLFAEDAARQLKGRGVNLAGDVSAFVLKEGRNVLMDFEKRDFLLKKITLELKVIRALAYSLYRSMYWANMNGVLQAANPYRDFMNRDQKLAEGILRDYRQLKE